MPIQNGLSVVATIIIFPNRIITALIAGPKKVPNHTPVTIVTAGVTIMSTFVSLDTIFPNSTLIHVAIQAPTGPPNLFPANPTITEEKITRFGAFNAIAIATAIAGPVISFAIGHMTSDKKGICNLVPIVFRIVPINKEANKPIAIEPNTSIPYL